MMQICMDGFCPKFGSLAEQYIDTLGDTIKMSNSATRRRICYQQNWIDLLWAILFLILLGTIFRKLQSGYLCHQMGVDFRGYYASAQIAWEHGFAAVYNQDLQKEFQSTLVFRCPTPDSEPPLYVAMPYLPVFVVLFLPFAWVDFTASYFIWLSLQTGLFFLTLIRFSRAMGVNMSAFRLLQWGICLPLISNLYLGQINALLVWLFAEFVLAFVQNKSNRSGLWLSALLIKPHMLVLLLPGFVLRRNWSLLLGFLKGSAIILFVSIILAGFQGLAAMVDIAFQFAGSLIQTATGMMNFRSLALNLETIIPAWISWLVAFLGVILVLGLVIPIWLPQRIKASSEKILLIVITLLGTFIISWHSHFYMQMMLVPLFLYLDINGLLSQKVRFAWLCAPPIIYIGAHLLDPTLERNIFGVGMLTLNIYLFFVFILRTPILQGLPHEILSGENINHQPYKKTTSD